MTDLVLIVKHHHDRCQTENRAGTGINVKSSILVLFMTFVISLKMNDFVKNLIFSINSRCRRVSSLKSKNRLRTFLASIKMFDMR